MGILEILFGNQDKGKKNKNWFLSDDEKEQMNSGNYENYNFEEEDTEEDDYYHEDEN